mmetsp:Transcript_115853/g.201573  ORF Transcript_115853/g.201573 Transcript_115853/m.201573 type:complete len:329 (-) Transcript_115853:2461-3447(-)
MKGEAQPGIMDLSFPTEDLVTLAQVALELPCICANLHRLQLIQLDEAMSLRAPEVVPDEGQLKEVPIPVGLHMEEPPVRVALLAILQEHRLGDVFEVAPEGNGPGSHVLLQLREGRCWRQGKVWGLDSLRAAVVSVVSGGLSHQAGWELTKGTPSWDVGDEDGVSGVWDGALAGTGGSQVDWAHHAHRQGRGLLVTAGGHAWMQCDHRWALDGPRPTQKPSGTVIRVRASSPVRRHSWGDAPATLATGPLGARRLGHHRTHYFLGGGLRVGAPYALCIPQVACKGSRPRGGRQGLLGGAGRASVQGLRTGRFPSADLPSRCEAQGWLW